MKNFIATYTVDTKNIKQQILYWSNQFKICCFFNNNNFSSKYNSFECLAGVANDANFISEKKELELLLQNKKWYFGHISYDYKNELFGLTSSHINNTQFQPICFFEPTIVVYLNDNNLTIECDENDCENIFIQIVSTQFEIEKTTSKIVLRPRITKEDYIKNIALLKQHLQLGDCYEINYCQEFFADNVDINPLTIYDSLNKISPTPFSCFYKKNDKYVLCVSPERFLKKEGKQLVSQPIKGTAKRDLQNIKKDEEIKLQLSQSQKEKSENIMIVDLVRNDLSKVCKVNSVVVDELMKIYSYTQVHQMISTVVGELKENINFYDILKALFPMGSMTGAPKYKVMQLIEQYEKTQRNIYSGSIGYITPNHDFDFNVVIRSIVYNASTQFLNYEVGSAITHYSIAENEYEECLLKASGIERVLGN